jgi:transcriptional regulator with XRE-family HTH domain
MTGERMDDGAYVRELARRVRLHCRYQNLTQQQLADRAGLSRAFVAAFETGRHGIQVTSLRRVAAALGISLSALIQDPTDTGSPLLTPVTKGAGQ